jgi:hypothetical protein
MMFVEKVLDIHVPTEILIVIQTLVEIGTNYKIILTGNVIKKIHNNDKSLGFSNRKNEWGLMWVFIFVYRIISKIFRFVKQTLGFS